MRLFYWAVCCFLVVGCQPKEDEWRDLFNGEDLDGWKASEYPETFSVVDGNIVAFGPRAHLFYEGPDPEFENFELELEIMTHAGANSGVFIGTEYQDEGWPSKGFEIQINNSHPGGGDYIEYRKTGSLYGVRNVYKAHAKDSTWFTLRIRVQGQHIIVKVDDRITTVDYRLPEDRPYSLGTIALQGHDPDSKVLFRKVSVRKLPDETALPEPAPTNDTLDRVSLYQSQNFPLSDMDAAAADSTIDKLTAAVYETGINAGVMIRANQPLPEFLSHYPVWTGRRVTDLELDMPGVRENLGDADYVAGMVDVTGWAPVTEPAEFLDTYINLAEKMLRSGLIDVWDDAGSFPPELASEALTLWTTERMDRLIDAAKANDVAIEINCSTRSPHFAFIRRAKEKGCRFVCGNAGLGDGAPELNYFLDAIDSAFLTYKDIYAPPYR